MKNPHIVARMRWAFAWTVMAAASTHAAQPAGDFTGFWRPASVVTSVRTVQGEAPPLTDAYRKIYASRTAAAAKGDRSWDKSATECLPIGLPRLLAESPFEFAQTAQTTLFLYQWNRLQRPAPIRTAHVDFDRVYPYYLGHPFARWDGKSLVVDSIDFNDDTAIDASGLPHSDMLHVIERFSLKDANTLEAVVTFDDAKAFTRKWDARFTFQRMTGDVRLSEDVCEDRQGIQNINTNRNRLPAGGK